MTSADELRQQVLEMKAADLQARLDTANELIKCLIEICGSDYNELPLKPGEATTLQAAKDFVGA